MAARTRVRRRLRRYREFSTVALGRLANAFGTSLVVYRAPGELRQCPACRSERVKHLDVMWQRRAGGGRFAAFMSGCRRCGVVFVNPLPPAAELNEYYGAGAEYAQKFTQRAGARAAPSVASRQRLSAEQAGKLEVLFGPVAAHLDVLHPPPGSRVLDYGCGPGRLLDRLQILGWDTYGIEPAVKVAFHRHHELDAPPAEPTFSMVMLHHVLEHLLEPLDVLRALHRSTLDGGIIYVSVPRFDELPRHRDFDYVLNPRGHIMAYTPASLEALFALAGFETIPIGADPRFDAATGGQPRRLRWFGRKVARQLALPREPLRRAETALSEYWTLVNGQGHRRGSLPVRLQAAVAQWGHVAHGLAHDARMLRKSRSQ
jgi:SAM-dependent methyltransferase